MSEQAVRAEILNRYPSVDEAGIDGMLQKEIESRIRQACKRSMIFPSIRTGRQRTYARG